MRVTSIELNNSVEGETIEGRIERLMNNNEPIGDEAPVTFTERKEGVRPEYNIRTDRFEVAIDAMDKVAQSKRTDREERRANRENINPKDKNGDGGAESAQGSPEGATN